MKLNIAYNIFRFLIKYLKITIDRKSIYTFIYSLTHKYIRPEFKKNPK